MAMTVRLPAELDARLEQLARARHQSKHAVLVDLLERGVTQELTTAVAVEVALGVADRYSELLRRLEEA